MERLTSTLDRPMSRSERGVPKEEEKLTTAIEEQTSKLPSASFLALALGPMAVSAIFALKGNRGVASFLGTWVPTILILGLYNKVVKLEHEITGA